MSGDGNLVPHVLRLKGLSRLLETTGERARFPGVCRSIESVPNDDLMAVPVSRYAHRRWRNGFE